jgi:hypothetical protein
MMRLTIILFSLSLICTNKKLTAQNLDSSKYVLMQLEKDWYLSKSPVEKTKISFKRLQLFTFNHLENEEECLDECKRINSFFLSEHETQLFYWNAAIIYMIHADYVKSLEHIQRYKQLIPNTTMVSNLLELLAINKSPYDSINVMQINPELKDLHNCLIYEEVMQQKKGRNYILSSYIIPGSGLILKGYYIKGATSFLLNSGGLYLLYILAKNNLYANAVGYSLLTLMKFYQGNLVYSQKVIAKRDFKKQRGINEKCHQQLEQLLMANPINFKY